MPLITTETLMILYPFLIELGKKGVEKAVETGGKKLTNGCIKWVKSLFYKENEPKKALKDLMDAPDDHEKQIAIKALIENSIEDNSDNKKFLIELLEKMPKDKTNINISNSKNINIGNVNTGGDFRIGDNYNGE